MQQQLKNDNESAQLARFIASGMSEKKATDIKILDLRNIKSAIADFFVICTGNSDTQVQAIAENIEKQVWLALQQDVWKKEGLGRREWVLIDYVDVVAHVFQKEKRKFYGLEDLWGDAEIEEYHETEDGKGND